MADGLIRGTMRLIFEPVWNWPVILAAGLAMILLVVWTYPPRVRELSKPWRWSLLGLRLALVALLIAAMLRPALQKQQTDRKDAELVFLLDKSRSMGTTDGPGGRSRRESLLKLLADQREPLEAIQKEISVRMIDFDRELHPVAAPENVSDGNLTAVGKVLDELREQSQGDRQIAVVMFSDFAQRAGGEEDVDPLAAARRFAEQKSIPVHGVLFGTSELSSSGLDLAVEDLTLDQPVTFERKTVPVRFQVRLLGAAGRKVMVRLLLEDRTGKALGESGPFKEIPLSGDARPMRELRTSENAALIPVELSFMAEQAGEYKIAAEVVPADGEVKLSNNRLETLVTVRKGGMRVAYFDIPRQEQKYIRRLNETAKIQLDTQIVLPSNRQTIITPKQFTKGAYDVYIIGDLPADAFQQQGQNLLVELAARVREGAGLAMLGGQTNYGAGGYAATPLADLLPVSLSISEKLNPGEMSTKNQLLKSLQMLPTRDGERHYLMRLAGTSTENEQIWSRLPPMRGANKLNPRSGAIDILAHSAADDPLLFATDTGRGRVLALAVDETWRWHTHGFQTEHQRFWQQLMLWLARKEFDSDQPIWVRVEPRNFLPQSRIPIEFGARDSQGTPVVDADYQVEVLLPTGGEPVKLLPQRLGENGLAEFSQTLAPGDYWVRVAATKGGKSLGHSVLTRFVVDERDLEMDNPAADPGLMSEIAAMTGGTVLSPEDFGGFLKALLEQGLPSDLNRFERIRLWDGWPLLLLFVTLISAEWTIRKLKGLV
ncbi:hypothetical protein [Planctomicrobium sp. SH664]|uniref:hypothetical protein n=1 Tax=Planctomicrobium sp. SH664 TaxID=3448125 RepID=UPI003F5BF3B0